MCVPSFVMTSYQVGSEDAEVAWLKKSPIVHRLGSPAIFYTSSRS